VDKESNIIGENTFFKLREQRDQARTECDQAKIQRDVALRKLNKALQIAKDLRKLVESNQ
jgi:LPS O-antigen subunit length determinant protein (WzzB/FepE family)